MTTSDLPLAGPSSNWFALRKSLGPPQKRRKVDSASSDATSSFVRDTPHKQHGTDVSGEEADLETTEIKNGESIAALRKMVLGKVVHKTLQTTPGKYLALDCEMVGVGIEGSESSLARVSIVNYTGAILLDVFVRQCEKVVDYRTQWSGIRSTDLVGSAKPFKEVQQTVADLIKDRILVGHAICNDLKALLLSHPSAQIRDTQSLAYKHRIVKSRRPALRVLVRQELGITIQSGEHNSVTDARATMAIFRLYKKQWESGFRPLHVLSRISPASKSTTLAGLSPTPTSSTSLSRHLKRNHSESRELEGDNADGIGEALQPSSPQTCSPSSSFASTAQHASILTPRSKQSRRSQPPADRMERKGMSGTTTVTWKATRKGKMAGKGSEDAKRAGKVVEKWWKSLGGGKKGSIGL